MGRCNHECSSQICHYHQAFAIHAINPGSNDEAKEEIRETVATTVKARFREEPVRLKINKGKAKLVNELPKVEIVCPNQNFQKSFRVRESMAEDE